MTGPRVLGIDPSLTATGIASSAGWTEVVGSVGVRTDGYPERHQRLRAVRAKVIQLLPQVPAVIDLVVMEGPAYSRSSPSAFDRAALWWDLYSRLAGRHIPVAVVAPTSRAMYATGRGNAGKGAVVDAVARRWPLYATEGNDNKADAVVLMAMGLDWLGHPLCPMPKPHRRALDKVAWPVVPLADHEYVQLACAEAELLHGAEHFPS
jgi:crossover junction endodeoxyribonuclease RuvC